MKNLILIIYSVVQFNLFGQVIQNGSFEDGPYANFLNQIYAADFWDYGCNGGTNLYDCQATPVVGGPLNGQIVVGTPQYCINPRNNGNNNCRYGSIRCQSIFNASGGNLWNELSADLLPGITYTIQGYVARGQQPAGLNVPSTRRIEVVLRATTDGGICNNGLVVPIPIDIRFNACNWTLFSTTFELTSTQAAWGYDKIEFREITQATYDAEEIYIDDIELLGGVAGLFEDMEAFSELINIYPNPATSELHIETKASVERIVIMDLMGKVLFESANSNTISLESLSAGLYIIQLEYGNEKYSQRIVKQ